MHKLLYFGNKMNHSLINSNQLRHYGVVVHDNPYETDPTRTMGIEIDDNVLIPFSSQGSTAFFETRYPDDDELDTYPHVVITCDKPWDPYALIMPGGRDNTGHPKNDRMIHRVTSDSSHGVNCHHHMYETNCVSMFVNGNTEQLLVECMISSVHVSLMQHMEKLQSKTRHSQFEPEQVAAVFGVSLGTTKNIPIRPCLAGPSQAKPGHRSIRPCLADPS